MKTLKERQDELVEEFSMFEDWLDKYEYLIDLGKNLEAFPEELKTDDRLLVFRADSDAIITKGIISLLVSVYSGRSAGEIAADDFSFVDRLGLKENLSPTRANGLVSMIETIRNIALKNC